MYSRLDYKRQSYRARTGEIPVAKPNLSIDKWRRRGRTRG